MKSELKRQCAQEPVAMAFEIERLTVQVARCKEFIESTLICWSEDTELGRNLIQQGNRIVSGYPSDWLATHDAKVRDDALDEMAKHFKNRFKPYLADEIRSMKGTK